MRKKRFLALVLSTAMVMGSSVSAFAANVVDDVNNAIGKATGTASVEGWVDKDVFRVTLPTVVKRGTAGGIDQLDFILDPQGLIKATSGNKYTASNTANNRGIVGVSNNNYSSLYFTTVDNGATLLSTNSDALTISNNGAVSVNVSLKASIKDAGDIVVSDNTSLTGDATSMYLQLVSDTESKVISAADTAINTTISDCDDAFEVSYNKTDNKYEYKIVSADNVDYPEVSFHLTGSCNESADWSGLVNAKPQVEVAWEVVPVGYVAPKAPSVATTTFRMTANSAVEIPVDLGTGDLAATGISKIMVKDLATPSEFTTDKYNFSNGKIVINETTVNGMVNNANLNKRVLEIEFNDTAKTKATVTLTK